MKILFIHQNFPGQYLHLVQHLRAVGGHEIIGLGEAENIKRRGTFYGITTIGYPAPEGAGEKTHHYLHSTEAAVRRGQTVARALLNLREKGFVPDVISLHPGWGEGLFVRDIFPSVPILMFCEFFFHAEEADMQFDPEFSTSLDWQLSVRIRNAPQLLSLASADAFICPTQWQASRYPGFIRDRLHLIHDGIDTGYMHPDTSATLTLQPLKTPGESRVLAPGLDKKNEPAPEEGEYSGPPLTLSRKDKVVTYMARNLEPYRGFHVFMRALPEIQKKHPDAHVLVVGADGVSYSPALPNGETYKARYLAEAAGKVDLSRVHFLGRIPYISLRAVFRISSAHIYLTYPFVLSWSMLEAMSCESLLIASRTAPVEEVLVHGKNGLMVDFFNREELLTTLDTVLTRPLEFAHLRRAARETVLARFELGTCLAKQTDLLQKLADGGLPVQV